MMTSEIAAVNPISTARERKSATKPSRSTAAASSISATISASSAASAVARATLPPAIGAIAAAVRIELVDVGPTWACRIVPASP